MGEIDNTKRKEEEVHSPGGERYRNKAEPHGTRQEDDPKFLSSQLWAAAPVHLGPRCCLRVRGYTLL